MSAEDCRSAYRARWNKVNRAVAELTKLMRNVNPDEVDGTVIADCRANVEDITQCFHEFNAYRNAYDKFPKRGRAS